jgi:hypothetical protein
MESELIDARKLARLKSYENMNEDEKKEDRRAANRLSAFQSRQRRKTIVQDLQRTVAQITKDGVEQRKENAEMKSQLDILRKENELLRRQLTVATAASGNAPLYQITAPQTLLTSLLNTLQQQQQQLQPLQQQQQHQEQAQKQHLQHQQQEEQKHHQAEDQQQPQLPAHILQTTVSKATDATPADVMIGLLNKLANHQWQQQALHNAQPAEATAGHHRKCDGGIE